MSTTFHRGEPRHPSVQVARRLVSVPMTKAPKEGVVPWHLLVPDPHEYVRMVDDEDCVRAILLVPTEQHACDPHPAVGQCTTHSGHTAYALRQPDSLIMPFERFVDVLFVGEDDWVLVQLCP